MANILSFRRLVGSPGAADRGLANLLKSREDTLDTFLEPIYYR